MKEAEDMSAEENREIRIELELDRDFIVMHSVDTGKPFDLESVIPPDLNVPKEGGYGIWIVRRLMDEVAYTRTGKSENHWRLVKRFGKEKQ